MDNLQEPVTHAAIKEGDLDSLKAIVKAAKNARGELTKDAMNLLEARDRNGMTCFAAAIHYDQAAIIEYFFSDEFSAVDPVADKEGNDNENPLKAAFKKPNKP